MKYSVLILILGLLLSGCVSTEAPETEQATAPTFVQTETSAPTFSRQETVPVLSEAEETLALSYDAYRVVYNITTEGMEETAEFQGISPEGDLLWSYRTGAYSLTQMPRIQPLGAYEDRYYFVEDGTVVALCISDGSVLFKNTDFGGSPAPDAFLLDEYGYLYLAGYDGPDFFAMDPQGHTVERIPSLSEEYIRPFEIHLEDGRLVVDMESDSQGNSGNFPCYVDRDWLPQSMG